LFTSETKKAASDREAPVNHGGYLRTLIHKTHVVTSVIPLWMGLSMQICALTLDVGWSGDLVTEIFQKNR